MRIDDLERVISNWPKVSRRLTRSQIVFSNAGVNFCWLSPSSGMIQLSPCLGPNSCTRRLERDGNLVKIVRQKTGLVEAAYQDPERILDKRFSYPGFMRSATSRKGALELIGQAYDQVENQRDDVGKAKKIMTQQQEAHMETEVLTVEISKTLHDRLKQAVGRLKSKLKSYAKTEQSLIENALTKFLDELESGDK